MLSVSTVIKSPAAPSAVLLYGIVFLFAIAYHLGIPWVRAYTIALYMGVSAWAAAVVFDRIRAHRPSLNRIDLLFAAFLASVLLSAAINWWEGTAEHFKLMPVFFLAPYVLGRAMLSEDCCLLRYILIGMGVLLLLPIFPAYLHVLKSGLPYVNTSLAPLL
ncbi:MAG TPA: hypothetical protein VFX71_01595, partial [Hyphomicrobium sp.]|nr:hypothetical protein [Hyphomicrobium sp.]